MYGAAAMTLLLIRLQRMTLEIHVSTYRYHEVPDAELPRTESLKDTIERIMPYWESNIFPALKTAHTLLVVAHGNSLRGIIKHLKHIFG